MRFPRIEGEQPVERLSELSTRVHSLESLVTSARAVLVKRGYRMPEGNGMAGSAVGAGADSCSTTNGGVGFGELLKRSKCLFPCVWKWH